MTSTPSSPTSTPTSRPPARPPSNHDATPTPKEPGGGQTNAPAYTPLPALLHLAPHARQPHEPSNSVSPMRKEAGDTTTSIKPSTHKTYGHSPKSEKAILPTPSHHSVTLTTPWSTTLNARPRSSNNASSRKRLNQSNPSKTMTPHPSRPEHGRPSHMKKSLPPSAPPRIRPPQALVA
jgi:hypothetical protein